MPRRPAAVGRQVGEEREQLHTSPEASVDSGGSRMHLILRTCSWCEVRMVGYTYK
jgi:hypothetical protein